MYNIAFCGIDGSGKSTLIEYLVRILQDKYSVVVAKCPFESKKLLKDSGNELFGDVKDVEMKRIAMAFEFVNYHKSIRNVEPQIILSDRYSICYRLLNIIDNITVDTIKRLDKIFNLLPEPDLYVFCDITPQTAYNRLITRGNFVFEEENIEILSRLSLLYKNFFRNTKVPTLKISANSMSELDFELKKIEKIIKGVLQ